MIVDLFAGAGGWDVAARRLGLPDPVGYELDEDAVKTRRAADMPTVWEDIAKLKPCGTGTITGLIASPPCQSFSSAGKRTGLNDERGQLVWKPMEWARAARPEWCAWEQVPEVLPIWRDCAAELRSLGYSVWTGLLDAERYGVPQTRTRAILIASRVAPAVPPEPTHQRYEHGVPQGDPHACGLDNMFDAGVKPWVSMAEALGWESGTDLLVRSGQNSQTADGPVEFVRTIDAPAPTLGTMGVSQWKIDNTPAHRGGGKRVFSEAVSSITAEQGAVLQTFPSDHPFTGSREAVSRQIGNAIPPMLAEAVLRQVASTYAPARSEG